METSRMSSELAESRRLDWTNVLFFALTPVAALVLTWIYLARSGWSWEMFVMLAISSTGDS